MNGKKSTSSTIFERVDNDTRSAIVLLNQKLIDLRTEITAKLVALDTAQSVEQDTQRKHLSMLENEVGRALKSIEEVVSLVVSDELTHSQFLMLHHDDLEKFREMVSHNTDKIAEINDKL